MKANALAILICALFPISASASLKDNNIESRLDEIERRLQQQQGTGFINSNDSKNNLKFYGDVEFDFDAASRTGRLTSNKHAQGFWGEGNNERLNIGGRILLGFDGKREMADGHYAGFTVQPLAKVNGEMGLDDAAFYFGETKNWQIKAGRFEAWDMFAFNQDTFIEHSGNTANDLYSDGYGYIYMMKEGRGRSKNGGNLLVNKEWDNWYFEVNTVLEDGSALFADGTYHGYKLENRKNSLRMRPVLAWRGENVTVAAGMESNLMRNAWGYHDTRGQWVDQSRRTGYGLTMKWLAAQPDPRDNLVMNFNAAMLDAKDERDLSLGANGLWRDVELGYIFAHNKIDKLNPAAFGGAGPWLTKPGSYNIHTLHASWKLPDMLQMDNFAIYLGGYASVINSEMANNSHSDPRYGARLRMKYHF
ncbi:carbohydrate porin [Candidatus Pantoea multigeneris]|uniref:Porin n=1 Tax=Candidatus Pantoea multigeneris TaxID=2608357 RepID=A0ABX0RI01_9GAMM|nr:carbohydrate porin [Pantoea multigeneris]NIF24439.1 porin [Pantoea multigeneris]